MLNFKKAITVSEIFKNLVSLSLIFFIFCCLGNLYAQMLPVPDFPIGGSFAASEIARGRGIIYPILVETPDGTLHCAYAEGLELKYAISTDNGQTWTIDPIPTPTAYYYPDSNYGIMLCQLAIDSNGSDYILYNINTMQFPEGHKNDLYCSTNVSGSWQYELVKEAWHYYSDWYGYVEDYRPEQVIVDSQDKVHLFARKDGWWFYGKPLHELVRQSNSTWNDVTVVHIWTGHPDGISMITPRASIDSTREKMSVTFVNPGEYQSPDIHDLNLVEGDTNQSWGNYVTKNNDAKYAASVIDAHDNLHVVYVSADWHSLKYVKNWGSVEVIKTVEPPLFTNLQLSSYLELRCDEVYGLIAVT